MFDSIKNKLEVTFSFEPDNNGRLHIALGKADSESQKQAMRNLSDQLEKTLFPTWPEELRNKLDGSAKAEIKHHHSSNDYVQGEPLSNIYERINVEFGQSIAYPHRLYYAGQILNWLAEKEVPNTQQASLRENDIAKAAMGLAKKPIETIDEKFLADYLSVTVIDQKLIVAMPMQYRLANFGTVSMAPEQQVHYFARKAYGEAKGVLQNMLQAHPDFVKKASETYQYTSYTVDYGADPEQRYQTAISIVAWLEQNGLLREEKYSELLEVIQDSRSISSTPKLK